MTNRPDNVIHLRLGNEPPAGPTTQDSPLYGPPEPPPLNEFTAWNGVPLGPRAPLPPPKEWASTPDTAAYTDHPTVRSETLNGQDQPLGPACIDYIALQQGVSVQAACKLLKSKLAAGLLHAIGSYDRAIDATFWKHVSVDPNDGSISGYGSLPWFKLQASELLAMFPPRKAWIAHPNPRRREHMDQNELNAFVRDLFQSELDAGRPLPKLDFGAF